MLRRELWRDFFSGARKDSSKLLCIEQRETDKHEVSYFSTLELLSFERRITKLRTGLLRVLYLVLGGRGRLPTNSRPLVHRTCAPFVSVFDPPNYVLASLQDCNRVSARRGHVYWRENRTLPAPPALSKGSKRTAAQLGNRPRRLQRMTPEVKPYGRK